MTASTTPPPGLSLLIDGGIVVALGTELAITVIVDCLDHGQNPPFADHAHHGWFLVAAAVGALGLLLTFIAAVRAFTRRRPGVFATLAFLTTLTFYVITESLDYAQPGWGTSQDMLAFLLLSTGLSILHPHGGGFSQWVERRWGDMANTLTPITED